MTSHLHDGAEQRPKRERDAFSSALSAIRGQLRRGDYVLGEALIIKDLSQGLKLSPTPIREALARLSGEGLVEERRPTGYFAPQLGVTELAELYEAHQTLVLSAFRQRAPGDHETSTDVSAPAERSRPAAPAATYPERIERLFDRIVRLGGNSPLYDAYRRVADRLAPARLAESLVLDALDDEMARMADVLEIDMEAAAHRIRSFHGRRLGVVQEIVRVVRGLKDHKYSTNID